MSQKIRNLWIRRIHLWLGLSSGLVVLFLSITGCILSFQREIEDTFQSYRSVAAQHKKMLPPSELKAIALKQLPSKHLHGILYEGENRAAQAIFYELLPNGEDYDVVFLNPYDGKVLKVKDMDTDFFRIVVMGHFYLWLPPNIGQPIIATSTAIFVLLLISGLVLWWPVKKSMRKQAFQIKWKARWRRKNYDLHNVLGFYVMGIALVLSVTGLVWGFQWFANGLHGLAGGEKSLVYTEPLSDTTQTARIKAQQPAIDQVWHLMKDEYPNAQVIEVHIPETPASPIAANANPDRSVYWKLDYRYFDQYTLEELPVDHIYGRFTEADGADKMLRMNYDIHTGAIWGLPGKMLMFFASLIIGTLPVTGFLVWLGRIRKPRPKTTTVQVKARRECVPAEVD